MRRRILAVALGLLLAPIVLELALQVASLFVNGDRSGEVSGPVFALCQGDSNTFGLNLPAQLAYPGQLEALLRERGVDPCRVVNRGVPGKPTWVAARELKSDLPRYAPKFVLILCGVNDRNQIRPADWLDRWLSHSRALALIRRTWKNAEEQTTVHAAEGANRLKDDSVTPIAKNTTRITFADRELEERPFLLHFGNPDAESVAHWIYDDLADIADLCRSAHATPIVCGYFEDNDVFIPVNHALSESCRALGIHFIDPRPQFAAAFARVDRSQLVFPDAHLKAAGYAILVRVIVNALIEARWLDGPAIEDELAPIRDLAVGAPLIRPWMENGELMGVEVECLPNLDAQILLSTRLGETPVAAGKFVHATPESQSSARVGLARERCFQGSVAAHDALTVTLDAQGKGRVPLPRMARQLKKLYAAAVFIEADASITAISPTTELR